MASDEPGSMLDRSAVPGTEIERKFLVAAVPDDLAQYPSERIVQGYLALDPDGAEVRLRRRGYHTLLTVKQGSGLARAEEEFLIDGPRFERLWAGTSGRRVEKTRHLLPLDGDLTLEVDVFDGALTGLVLAEVEFASAEAAAAFQPPAWLRPEVTGDARYKNARLALDGIPDRKTVGEHGLLDGEPVTAGLVQVALAQIDTAADALQGRDAEEYGKAVHTARKAFKRVRALVRVARDGLGPEIAARDNAALRGAGARLSGARDAQVVVQTLDGLVDRFPDDLPEAVVAGLRAQLTEAYDAADEAARADDGAVDEVLTILAGTRDDVAGWELGEQSAEVLAAGLARIHRKGRKALRAVHDSDSDVTSEARTEALHELRKRAKDLWHAAELLEVAAPKRMRVLAAQAHTLADRIGDDHDLAVLGAEVQERADAFASQDDADALSDAIVRRRRKLQRQALRVADEIYDRRPAVLLERVRELGDA